MGAEKQPFDQPYTFIAHHDSKLSLFSKGILLVGILLIIDIALFAFFLYKCKKYNLKSTSRDVSSEDYCDRYHNSISIGLYTEE